MQNVGRDQVEERDLHRFFGTQLNNEVWGLIDDGLSPESDLEDRELALYGAYASLRHWLDAGNSPTRRAGSTSCPASRRRSVCRTSRCGTRRGALELVQGHPDEMADWDAAFAHEALARALAATGDREGGRTHLATAIELCAALPDPEDRAILEGEFARPPWFGLR